MTEAEQLEFIQRLKSEPEFALGVMELTLDILVYQHGSKEAKELVLRALTNAINSRNTERTRYLNKGNRGEND